jgi:hypothetical protein
MENVLVLKPKDGVRVDQEKLTSLYMQLGEAAAEANGCTAKTNPMNCAKARGR